MNDDLDYSDDLRASAAHRSRAIAGPIVAGLAACVVGYMSYIGYLARVDLILNILLLVTLSLSPFAARNAKLANAHAALTIALAFVLFIYSSLAGVGVMNSGLPVLIMIQMAAGIYLGMRGLRLATGLLTVFTVALVLKLVYFPSATELAVGAGQVYGRIFQFGLAFLAVHWVLSRNLIEQGRLLMQLERSNTHKSEFLAHMSHEIRTPLNGILGMAQAIKTRPIDDKTLDMVDTIVDSGETLNTVLNDVLDLSKIEAGKLTIAPTEADLRETLQRMAQLWKPSIEEKGLQLRIEIAPDLPRRLVFDPVRVRQCVTNLLSNAVKFTDRGRITLAVRSEGLDTDERQIFIEVTDTGIGMSDEVQARLFQPFEQGEKYLTRRYGGTGLGLTISRSLAMAMGGDIVVESVPGQGSHFTLSFVTQLADTMDAVADTETSASEASSTDLAGKRLLLVDDVATNRLVARHLLGLEGIEVVEAVNGRDALEKIENGGHFDAILMDLHMPVMDGAEATRQIRIEHPDLPVLAMTADVVALDPAKLQALSMDGLIAKPVERGAMCETLSAIFSNGGTRPRFRQTG
ncbi:MAG: response regulator [Alphaproteobacteria bacterium]|nr:response regulator [Alphaproteobacteria bacterium]